MSAAIPRRDPAVERAEAERLLAEGRRLHFMGVGGAGMSALAELAVDLGVPLSGCDSRPGPASERVAALGVDVLAGHDAAHADAADALVVTSAVPADHPEVARARALGRPVVRRAALLGALMARERGIAIAGTHGKSTTTAMTGAVLAAAGLDPTVVVGGRIRGGAGNVRIGGGGWFVAEADEFDRSFLALAPAHAIVNNVEADHLDTYETGAAVEAAFAAFAALVPAGGTLALSSDDAGARRVPRPEGRRVVTFGLAEDADVRAEDVLAAGLETTFGLVLGGVRAGSVRLAMPGRHNVRNALGAAAVAWSLGIDPVAIKAGLAAARGVERRFELVHVDSGVTIVDDYAHHPTEVAAALAGARAAFPGRRLVAVFQPHLFSRTRDFAVEFGAALAAADLAFVAPIYPAREEPIEGVTGALVSDAARAAGGAAVADLDSLDAETVAAALEPGDVVLTMGAGDVDGVARALAAGRTAAGRAPAGAKGNGR